VGDAAPGVGLWERHDLLATLARLAASRRVEALASCALAATAGCGAHRLDASLTRQRECASSWGGEQTGKDPTNRGKLGTKRHIVVDRHGVPLAVTISGSNVHDSKRIEEAIDAIPPLRLPGRSRGRPRKRPVKLHADKGYSRHEVALRK
jgi:Transposase DDE domain